VIDLAGMGFTTAQLDSQDLVAVFDGRIRSANETPPDRGSIRIEFIDGSGGIISFVDVPAQKTVDCWELVGGRVHLPPGNRTRQYRSQNMLRTGLTNDSFFDNAFMFVVPDTVAPNIGGYGNTDADSTQSTAQHIALRYPDLHEELSRGLPHVIRWDSYNN